MSSFDEQCQHEHVLITRTLRLWGKDERVQGQMTCTCEYMRLAPQKFLEEVESGSRCHCLRVSFLSERELRVVFVWSMKQVGVSHGNVGCTNRLCELLQTAGSVCWDKLG